MNNLARGTCFFLMLLALKTSAQKAIAEKEAIDRILERHPALKAAALTLKQSKALQKTAINLPNPELLAESPSGDFMTVGVLQSIDFPTVYVQQHQLYKARTQLAEKQQNLSTYDVRYQAMLLYLNWQYSYASWQQLRGQDSLYALMATNAERQRQAGQIDKIAQMYAAAQYGEIHNQFLLMEATFKAQEQQLKTLTGIRDSLIPAPFGKSALVLPANGNDTTQLDANPLLQYYRQSTTVSRKNWKLEQQRVLPGLVGGYLNQGAKDTPSRLRIRAGITVPLWFWQYTGSMKAAKYGYEASIQELNAQQQQIFLQWQEAMARIQANHQALNYYETKGLAQADELIQASRRVFESGQSDYVSHLRTVNDAYAIKLSYLQILKNYNTSLIEFHYLNGSL